LAQVADGDLAEGINLVAANTMVGGHRRHSRSGLGSPFECNRRCEAVKGTVRAPGVVVVAESVELELQLGQRMRRSLFVQESLRRLVKTFDLAAGLGMVGR